MHVLPRRLSAGLLAATAVMSLALTQAPRADAAPIKVEIASKATANGIVNPVMSPRASGTKLTSSDPNNKLRTFLKEDVGNQAARYRWSFAPDMCLTGTQSSSKIFVEKCDFGPDQLWTQGFSSGAFKEFRNVKTGRSAKVAQPKTDVIQEIFTGANNQLWQVRPV